jgi:hypothetical protein
VLRELAVEFRSNGANGFVWKEFELSVGGGNAKSFTRRYRGEQGGAAGGEEIAAIGGHIRTE